MDRTGVSLPQLWLVLRLAGGRYDRAGLSLDLSEFFQLGRASYLRSPYFTI